MSKYEWVFKLKRDWISGNYYFNDDESLHNAKIVSQMLLDLDFSIQSTAAMLGNMKGESGINPAIWENLEINEERGFGLVQWTPATKFIEWAGGGWDSDWNLQLKRILWEVENDEQWIETSEYPLSFQEFRKSNLPPEELAYAWMYNYERPASLDHEDRKTAARYYYENVVMKQMKTSHKLFLLLARMKRKKVI